MAHAVSFTLFQDSYYTPDFQGKRMLERNYLQKNKVSS